MAHVLPGSGDDRRPAAARAGSPYRARVRERRAGAERARGARGGRGEPGPPRERPRAAATQRRRRHRPRHPALRGPHVYLTEILVQPPDDGRASALTPDARVRAGALARARAARRARRSPRIAALDALAARRRRAMRARGRARGGRLGARALAAPADLAAVDVFVASAPAEAARSRNLPDAALPPRRRGGGDAATARGYGARAALDRGGLHGLRTRRRGATAVGRQVCVLRG